MLSKTTFQAIRMSAVSALALATACGGDEEPSATPPPGGGFDAAVTTPDGGTGVPPAMAEAGACITTAFGTGAQCTLPGGGIGYQSCVNGVPMGACMSLIPEGGIGSILGDGGLGALLDSGLLGDAGLGIGFQDGSITFGDATIALPEAGTIRCAQGLECSSIGGSFGLPISACVEPGMQTPPSCPTPMQPCKIGMASGTCTNLFITNVCLVPCN